MRFRTASVLFLSGALALMGLLGCSSSSWCPDCGKVTAVQTINYQPEPTYLAGSPITLILPNPGGGTPTQYLVTTGTLPAGLTLNPITGHISGTPTTPGVYTITVQANNAANAVTQTFVLTVVPAAPLALSYPTPQVFAAGSAIPSQNPTLGQDTPGVATTYAISAGQLPTGLTLGSDGRITGTPTIPVAAATFTVLATNGTRSAIATATYTITPAEALVVNYITPKVFTVTTAITTQQANIQNATPGIPTTFTLTGALPTGLSLNSATGDITGTPTSTGVFPFTIIATNGTRSANAQVSYTVTPASPLTLAYATPRIFTQDSAIPTQVASIANATPGVVSTFSLSAGSLPPGLLLDANTGSLTGTPTTPGVYPFTITAVNGTRSANALVDYTVTPSAALTLTYATPRTFPADTSILAQSPALTSATPGVATTYALTDSLPAGLALNGDTGDITGTPTVPGVYPFTITATNGTRSATASPTYIVTPAVPMTLAYTTPLTFTAGAAIATQTPTITQETPGLTSTYAVTTAVQPPGLTLQADGSLTGTPTTPGIYPFTITATNGARTTSAALHYTVTPALPLSLSYPTPLVFTSGVTIATQTPTIDQETPGLTSTYALSAGSLPDGLTLNADGTITGAPITPGVYAFTITATNGSRTADGPTSYTVTPSVPITLGYTTPLVFPAGSAISNQFPTIVNETPGVTSVYLLTSGALPTGLTLNPSGTISGTPTAPGVYPFTITVTNGTRSAFASTSYTVTPSAPMTLSYASPQVFTSGTVISTQGATAANETPGVTTTYALTGTLPTGLSLNTTTGDITGTPTSTGVYPFTITATNGTRSANASVSYTVTPAAALTLSYTTPRTFTPNVAIASQSAVIANETPGISSTYAVTVGSLPTGLLLNAGTGAITGTPTVAGVYPFTVTATNGSRSAIAAVSYTVQSSAPTALGYLTPVSYLEKAAITPNVPSPSGGTPTAYTIVLGSLPAGLSLDPSTGAISGTPTSPTAGAVSVTIQGSNAGGSITQVLSITVTPAAPTALAYSTPVTYTNGTAIAPNAPNPVGGTPTGYTITSGILPAGLSIDPTTGIISGTPTAPTAGAVLITIRGSNVTGMISQTLSITVNDTAPTALNYSTPNTYTDGTPIQVNNPNPTGGTPNSYTITAGSLPAGLSLDPTTGVISGTPSAPNAALSVTIRGSNGIGFATKVITNTVNATAPTALHYTTPVSYILNTVIPFNDPNPVGGTPTSYSITAGSLPAGLSLNTTTGAITGTPTVTTAGPVSVTIRGLNASGNVSQTISINVPVPIVVTFSGNPLTLPVGQKAELAAVFSGGVGTIDQSIGTIQSGASLYTIANQTPGSITYTLTVTNGTSPNAVAAVTITWVTPGTSLSTPVALSGGAILDRTDPSYAADPFYGFKIEIPAQNAVCQDTVLTVMKEASIPTGATIPSPALLVSEVFNLTTTIGYPFQKPATVTLPYSTSSLAAGDVPVSFYWDAIYGKWVANGVKSFDPVNKRVTFTTLLPGRYVVVAIPNLATTLSNAATGFGAAVDGWFQPNQGVFDLPGGSSFGMSAFASWYYTDRKSTNSNAGLYTLFRQGPIASDDVAAKALISRLANGTLDSWSQIVDQSRYQLTDSQTGLALITALKVTGQPQIFLMGEARPVVDNALATVVWDYNAATSKFSIMDPNYPGTALTITWNPAAATGGWTAYDRSAGYFPTFTQYAMEGHTSIHRLVDYERAFQGSNNGWPNPPFASINLAQIGNLTNPIMNGTTLKIADASSVSLDGTITNGDETATYIYWSQNGGPRTAVGLVGNTFNFNIGSLVDPYGTRIMLETTANPCDPTFSHSGFMEFYVKDQALNPWFANSCFEQGYQGDGKTPVGWITEQGLNSGRGYPTTPTWNAQGVMTSYNVTWTAPSADSQLVGVGNDPICTTIPLPMVLDGTAAWRINNSATGAHISRAHQTITVPTTILHPQLSFYWSAVLQSAGHGPADQPYADVLIQDVTDPNNVTVVYFKHIAAQDPTYPGWQINGSWGAIPWQKVSLPNLTALKGHKLKITVTAADCTQGGHGGYVYLDNIACN